MNLQYQLAGFCDIDGCLHFSTVLLISRFFECIVSMKFVLTCDYGSLLYLTTGVLCVSLNSHIEHSVLYLKGSYFYI